MDINQIADMVEISRGRIEEHAPPSATDYALVDLWEAYQALKAQAPKWITAKEAAGLPDIVGKTVIVLGEVSHAALSDNMPLDVKVAEDHHSIMPKNAKVAVIE